MKSIVFYYLKRPVTGASMNGYSIVRVGCCKQVYVRAEIHNEGFETSLEKAKPREGETVLNSIPLD